MVNYNNSKIYKLVSFQTDKIYVGSTTQSLTTRKSEHKSNYKRWINGSYNYVSSFELIHFDDCDIILLEECPCKNKMELHKREREYIEKLDCVNKVIPTRTKKEYNNEHREYQKQYNKQYREDNKDKLREYEKNRPNKEERKQNQKKKYTCDCGKTLTIGKKSRHEKTKKHQNYINSLKI